ncbi:MAG: hypothetical protein PVH74_16840 [Desulfobacterales bacterium]
MMNILDSICKFIESTKDPLESEQDYHVEAQPAETEDGKHFAKSPPRDGMSPESAKFAIGRCAGNNQYEIQGIENKGRYFTAKIMDSKGHEVNQLLVDKLNGKVRFLR